MRKHTGVDFINYMLRRLLIARTHIEKQFKNGMSWDNRPNNWHLDHIKPLSKSKDANEFLSRIHYTNIQPLTALDNARKGVCI
jgi:uncharacterized LabA/DUF88 family protein